MTLQSLVDVPLPIIQAPMAGVQGSALAVAVSNAGGLGSLPGALLGPDALRQELAAMRAQTVKPFNVNFFCHAPASPNAEREAAWRARLAPYYEELGVDVSTIAAGGGRRPFGPEVADVLAEFRPAVVSFHFGLPSPELLARVRGWGAKVLSSATTVDEARWLEARGVDAIIAQGFEAGGHRGMFLSEDLTTQVGTLALVPHRCRRHRGRQGRRGRPGAGCGRRASGDRLPALSRSHHQGRASRRAEERGRPEHCPDQCVHRPARALDREPDH